MPATLQPSDNVILDSEVLSFEELQRLDGIKREMLQWEFYTFNEVFHAV